MKRPDKWREIKKFLLELHPELVPIDHNFAQSCKEMRQKNESKTASSQGGHMRNTMKIPQYLYSTLTKLDPDLLIEMSGRNHGAQEKIGKQLYKAFPEYKISRIY